MYFNRTKYIPIVFQLQNTNYFCQGHKIQNTLNVFKIHVFQLFVIQLLQHWTMRIVIVTISIVTIIIIVIITVTLFFGQMSGTNDKFVVDLYFATADDYDTMTTVMAVTMICVDEGVVFTSRCMGHRQNWSLSSGFRSGLVCSRDCSKLWSLVPRATHTAIYGFDTDPGSNRLNPTSNITNTASKIYVRYKPTN